ncbi:A disintegrin and metalloproteinase with thrombospondin motifs 18-like isoform X1 [Sycon ciliatum]|uniref:A disintegrin and metalloproteinase with thrombospondin motifs 18-like isoform X1 n=1 Tax=Sycon ciliatum TaxID=27933 RepID=UPI0031F66211
MLSFGVPLVMSTWCIVHVLSAVVLAEKQQKLLREDHAAELFRLAPGQKVPHHEIVYPWLVHPETDEYISHNVDSRRSRRSASSAADHIELPVIAVKFSGLGEDFHVKVAPNERLMPATFYVSAHHHDGKNSTLPLSDDFACHHHGIAVSHDNSPVAISTCDGVSGTVYDPNGGSFMIHPLPDHLHHADRAHYRHDSKPDAKPHIVYRRDVGAQTRHGNDTASCHVNAEHQLAKQPVDIEGADLQLVERALKKVSGETVFEMTEIFLGDHHAGKDRRKRNTKKYHLEVMLVADNMLFSRRKFRDNTHAGNYMLAIANLASLHFNVDRLDVDLAFVVSKILLLNRTEAGLNLGHHSEKTLSSFCMWQLRTQYTPYETSKDHYDLAILITGWKLCSYSDNRGCDELGRAYVSGACFKYRMCSVVYDNGLTAGFVLAHETGHSLSLRHDGENGCRNSGYLMSPTIAGRGSINFWSQCSKTRVARFVASTPAYCLRDVPVMVKSKPYDLVGRHFGLDQQCQLWMGTASRFCPYSYARDDVCQKLWCRHTNSNCRTANVPAASGTKCGYRRGWVCHLGQCVRDSFVKTTTQPVPTTPPVKVGVWGPWYPKGNCSRPCSGGIQVFTRYCVEKGTKEKLEISTCNGIWLKREVCNQQECPQLNNYLLDQCRAAGEAKNLRNTTWFPGYLAATRCRLVCKSTHNVTIDQLATDGTPCSYRYNDRCISGKCVSIGCDYVQHSTARYDRCGVCKGTGGTCQKVEYLYRTKDSDPVNVTVLRLPKGSRNIYIKEHLVQETSHLLLTTMNHVPVMDGAWMRGRRHTTLRVFMAGTEFYYRQLRGKPESLSSAVAPLNEDLYVKIVRTNTDDQRLNFRYYMKPGEVVDRFVWRSDSTPCSVTCGKGSYTQYPVCLEMATSEVVNPLHCIPSKYHVNRTMSCSRSPCLRTTAPPVTTVAPTYEPPSWKVSNWTACSVSCGDGVQARRVVCRYRHATVRDPRCAGSSKPLSRRSCSTDPCFAALQQQSTDAVHGGWSDFSDWTDCSLSCAGGIAYRSRSCTNPKPAEGGRNCTGHRIENRMCNVQPCGPGQRDVRVGICASRNTDAKTWIPALPHHFRDHSKSCALKCRPIGGEPKAVKDMNTTVPDGTRCSFSQNHRCIQGECRKVGCDNIVGSSAKWDMCGVCKGKGGSCVSRSSSYMIGHAMPGVYHVATLPNKIYSLTVTKPNQGERVNLVLRSVASGDILFSTDMLPRNFSSVTYVPLADRYLQIRIHASKEVYGLKGPILGGIQMLLNITTFSLRPSNPGLQWRYIVDSSKVTVRPVSTEDRFERVRLISGCSVTCGQGMITLAERCVRKRDNRMASIEFCRGLPPSANTSSNAACFRQACPNRAPESYEWVTQSWSSCSKTCGRGMQRRNVMCQRIRDQTDVSSNMCLSRARVPPRIRECNVNACPKPARWVTDRWEACSVTCGGGRQMRRVRCEQFARGQECTGDRPVQQRSCGLSACPAQPACIDKLSKYYCTLVKNFLLCTANQRYAAACCHTCQSG